MNDGSRDDTLAHLLDRSARDRRVQVVNLSRNFGKEAALTAGIDHASGDILIPMDIDLQDPPDADRPFIERWREGYDIVYGVRQRAPATPRPSASRRGWFYRAFNSMSPMRIPANVGDFRLIDRRAVEVLRRLPERNRFMKGLFAWVGFKRSACPTSGRSARRARASSTCGGCGTSRSTAWSASRPCRCGSRSMAAW